MERIVGQRKRRRETSEGGGRGRAVALAVVACAAVALGILSWQSEPRPQIETPPSVPARSTTTLPPPKVASPSTAKAPSVDTESTPARFRTLLDDWVRSDGGYVLSVTAVAEDGTATARYFNPRPINVGRAKARLEDGVPGLFVELRDRNYPGSTYTLAYDGEGDQLVGVYFQAVQRASYDVVFVRRR